MSEDSTERRRIDIAGSITVGELAELLELPATRLIGELFKNGIAATINQKIDVDKWVEDTKDLTFAHLKEIFVSVVILGHDYDETLKELESMKVAVSSDDYEKIMEKAEKKLGFGAYDDYGD